jgi:hypothetical protein
LFSNTNDNDLTMVVVIRDDTKNTKKFFFHPHTLSPSEVHRRYRADAEDDDINEGTDMGEDAVGAM